MKTINHKNQANHFCKKLAEKDKNTEIGKNGGMKGIALMKKVTVIVYLKQNVANVAVAYVVDAVI